MFTFARSRQWTSLPLVRIMLRKRSSTRRHIPTSCSEEHSLWPLFQRRMRFKAPSTPDQVTIMPKAHVFPSIPTKILLPIDFSPSSQVALEMAADLAKHFHAKLFLVNVIAMFPPSTLPEVIPEATFIQESR